MTTSKLWLVLFLGSLACVPPARVAQAPNHRSPCSRADSSGPPVVSYEDITGQYNLFLISGSRWDSGFPSDTGSLVVVAPDVDTFKACGSRLSCRPLPIAGTNIRMHVEGATGWVVEPWAHDSSMQTVYVSLASRSDSMWLSLGAAFDDVVALKGRVISRDHFDGTWFSIVDERTVNRGLWCALKKE